VSQPTIFTNVSLQYAHVKDDGEVLKIYTTLQSAKYMVELLDGYVLEVFTIRNKILAIGDAV
jgi:hypothetical protein